MLQQNNRTLKGRRVEYNFLKPRLGWTNYPTERDPPPLPVRFFFWGATGAGYALLSIQYW